MTEGYKSRMELTLRELRNTGCECDIVERFIHNDRVKKNVRSDLFGLFDVLAMSPDNRLVGIQVCGGGDAAQHYRKITMIKRKNAERWLRCGNLIELWAWRHLVVNRGQPDRKWDVKITHIRMEDLFSPDNLKRYA